MIRLRRLRTQAAIHAAFRGEERLDQALKLLVVDEEGKPKFDSGYWKKAKDQLRAESGSKCAYCEAPTSVVAHGDVEHFRPKDVYWWLAYCYDNYLFSCQICNQSYKGNHFPLADESRRMIAPVVAPGATAAQKRELVRLFAPDPLRSKEGQPWKQFRDACKAEGAYLLDPYVDDPERYFIWEADAALQEVAVRPRKDTHKTFYEAAVQYYGLNRPDLLAERWKTYSKLAIFRASYESPGIDVSLRNDIGNMLREMMGGRSAFAGMCRYFVKKVWNLHL